jgi:hypothetical protein
MPQCTAGQRSITGVPLGPILLLHHDWPGTAAEFDAVEAAFFAAIRDILAAVKQAL